MAVTTQEKRTFVQVVLMVVLIAAIVVLITAYTQAQQEPARAAAPTPTQEAPVPDGTVPVLDVLDLLTVAPETHTDSYDRKAFPHWSGQGEGCNTRARVLQRDSSTDVTYTTTTGCTVASGTWHSVFDEQTWTAASDVDIDHIVPLAEAWRSGAHGWDTDQRAAFANDLEYVPALASMTASLNRSKGDQDPARWIPPENQCLYVTQWVLIKDRWNLAVDPAEHAALHGELDECGNPRVVRADKADVPRPTGSPS